MFWLLVVLISLPVFIHGLRRKKWLWRILGAIPLALFLLFVLGTIYRLCMSHSSSWVYKQAFGNWPGGDVTVLEKRYRFGSDFTSIYLKCQMTDERLQGIIKQGFWEISRSEFETELYDDSPPWFTPLEDSPSAFYLASPYGQTWFSSSEAEALLSYNDANQIAYFYYRDLW